MSYLVINMETEFRLGVIVTKKPILSKLIIEEQVFFEVFQ